MIIIDDGSTDQTKAIANSYAIKNQKINLISQENKGPGRLSETYNKALECCSGGWIAILEGDDYWYPSKLEMQSKVLNSDVVFCYGAYLDKINGELNTGAKPPFWGCMDLKKFIPYLLMHESNLIPLTWIIKKESLLTIGGFHQDNSPAAVDMATLMHLIKLSGTVHYFPEFLGVWRHHETQLTQQMGVEIAKFNAELVFDYVNDLSTEALDKLKINKTVVFKKRNAVISASAFSIIRRKLQNNDGKDFLPLIKDLWNYGNLKRKCESIFCFLAYIFHLNIEFPFRLAEIFKLDH
jgi:glycosyltransferase involved in cell wall biosynthesis